MSVPEKMNWSWCDAEGGHQWHVASIVDHGGYLMLPEQMNCWRTETPTWRETWAGNSPAAASLPPRIRPSDPPCWVCFGPGGAWGMKPASLWFQALVANLVLTWFRARTMRRVDMRGDMSDMGDMADDGQARRAGLVRVSLRPHWADSKAQSSSYLCESLL